MGKPTKITIEFDSQISNQAPSTKFRYELHVAHTANNLGNKIISYEALFYASKGKFRCLFERNDQDIRFGQEFGIINKDDPRKESTRPNASVISTLTKLNHGLSIHLFKLIGTMQTNYIGVTKIQPNTNQWLSVYANDETSLDRLNRELRRFDIGLESMVIEPGNQGLLFAKFKHIGLDDFIYFKTW